MEKSIRNRPLGRYVPVVTISLILLIILCFLFQSAIGATENNYSALASLFSASRDAASNGHLARLITANFFHVNSGHLLSNIFGLLFFSSLFEILLGKSRVIIVMLLSALGGTLGSLLFHIVDWMVGSSTILFGVFGGLGVLILKYRRELGKHFITALISWFISLIPLTTLGYLALEKVDQGAHFGGFAVGILTTLFMIQQYPTTQQVKPLGMKGKVLLFALLAILTLSFIEEVVPLLPLPTVFGM